MRGALAASALIMATLSLGFAAPAAAAITRLVDDGLVPCVAGGLPIHATIGAALAAAAPGETIGVCPGTYPESVTIAKAGIILQAIGLAKVVNPGAGRSSRTTRCVTTPRAGRPSTGSTWWTRRTPP